MERNANYALVGLISTVLFVALAVFAVFLAGSNFNQSYNFYDIVFEGPVRGLAQGAEVHFNGIKVGDVRQITLDPKDPHFVIARARVTSDVPIRTDSFAMLEPLGITGVNYVQISAGSPAKALLRDTVAMGEIPRLSSRRDTLSDLLAGGGSVLQEAIQTLNQVNKLFSDRNIKSVSATLGNVEAVTAELKAHRSIIATAETTLQHADEATQQISALAKTSQGLVDTDGRQSLRKLAAAAEEIQGAAKALRVTLDKLQAPTESFAKTSLPELATTIESLQRATIHLDQVLVELRDDPRTVITKPPSKEIEVKP